MEFHADQMKIQGPLKTDGSFKVEFSTGEYERLNVAKLLVMAEKGKNWTVNVTPYGEEEKASEEELEGRTTQEEPKENKFSALWAVITETAKWEEITKENKEQELKDDLGIESFTELEDKELEELISQLQADIQMYSQQQLQNEQN